MVPPYSDRIPRVPPYSSSSQPVHFGVRDYHPVPSDFPDRSTNTQADSDSGLLPVRSPLLGESRLISLPPGTEMFHFPGSALPPYLFRRQCPGLTPDGFPHSDTHGSKLARSSPWFFAACRVLLRPLMPSHPPYALYVLTHFPFSKN